MTIRVANNHTPGVRTFYVASESKPGTQYVAVHTRRAHMNRWSCSCPDFLFRRQAKRTHRSCKHLRQLRSMARTARGVSCLAREIATKVAA
jgi:predicted nucleic acid-binding Zn finger protein